MAMKLCLKSRPHPATRRTTRTRKWRMRSRTVPLAEKLAVLFAGAAGRKAAVGASRWARVCVGAGAAGRKTAVGAGGVGAAGQKAAVGAARVAAGDQQRRIVDAGAATKTGGWTEGAKVLVCHTDKTKEGCFKRTVGAFSEARSGSATWRSTPRLARAREGPISSRSTPSTRGRTLLRKAIASTQTCISWTCPTRRPSRQACATRARKFARPSSRGRAPGSRSRRSRMLATPMAISDAESRGRGGSSGAVPGPSQEGLHSAQVG